MNWKKWVGFSVIALIVLLLSVPDARRIFSSKRKTKLFFGVLLSTSRAAGLASLLGVLLKKMFELRPKNTAKIENRNRKPKLQAGSMSVRTLWRFYEGF